MKKIPQPMLPAYKKKRSPNAPTTTAQRINTITSHVAHPMDVQKKQKQPPNIKRQYIQAKRDGRTKNSMLLRASHVETQRKPHAFRDLTRELEETTAQPQPRKRQNAKL